MANEIQPFNYGEMDMDLRDVVHDWLTQRRETA